MKPTRALNRVARIVAGSPRAFHIMGRLSFLAVILVFSIVPVLDCSISSAAEPATIIAKSPNLNVLTMAGRADLVGKLCLMVLLIFSIASWTIIIYKFLHIQTASNQTNHFVKECMSGGSLEVAYRNAAAYPDSPLAQILRESYLELEIEDWYKVGYNLTEEQRIDVAKAGIDRVLERTISGEIAHLENNLVFLALTSNVSPFIGLFGTVWGIMVTFYGLNTEGAAALSALAPGIATALITTVAGLAAAIPASVMYNYFTSRVKVLTSRMDAFALELSNIIQKQLLKQEV